jgi:8-oxo-dGTP diphosphatase
MNEQRLEGVIGIVEKNGRYLFGLESKDSPIKGKWRLVGGKLEGNENYREAMVRECREETGIVMHVDGFIGKTNGTYSDISIYVCHGRYFLGKLNPKLDEFSKVRWLRPEQVNELDVEPLSARVFSDYLFRKEQEEDAKAERERSSYSSIWVVVLAQ